MIRSAIQKAAIQDAPARLSLADVFHATRAKTLELCAPLEVDDYAVQSMPDASPVKWHLAHTTWFFEQFILKRMIEDYEPFAPQHENLFNSYYQTVGVMQPRELRQLLTRPTLKSIGLYREAIDEQMYRLLVERPDDETLRSLLLLGIAHEQQHQELILTDIKHAFASSPLLTAYRRRDVSPPVEGVAELKFIEFKGGIRAVGADRDSVFAFDNEQPRHRIWIEPFALSNQLITNREYLAFVRTGGYRRPEYWLSDGWQIVQSQGWSRPLYWQESLDSEFTLYGVEPLRMDAPVCHLSFYEADAFARWAGMRLPTEFEWESVASEMPIAGNFLESKNLHPTATQPAASNDDEPPMQQVQQIYGDAWEWTASPYVAYPGYAAPVGALGEYNGKFMCNQLVLRGGSCLTPVEHMRSTYRNFFPPHARWQCTGIRLAR